MRTFLDWFAESRELDPVLKASNRLIEGFEGKLTSSKYAKLAKCSADAALRDIKALLDRKVLEQEEGGGRSTSYRLREPAKQ